jgi:hypothetical protein
MPVTAVEAQLERQNFMTTIDVINRRSASDSSLPRVLMPREAYEALPDASRCDAPGLRKALVDDCNCVIDPDGTFHRVEFCIYRRED